MPDAGVRPRLVRVGCMAARAFGDGARGQVRAVFARSFYLTLGAQWICIGPPGLGDGPLNALCTALPPGPPALAGGDACLLTAGVLKVGAMTAITADGAARWSPPPPADWDKRVLAAGLAAFARALPEALPSEGLALLLRPPEGRMPPVATTARAPAHHLQQLVHRAVDAAVPAGDVAPLAALLGLGPGLTPSGDDFLGGAMVALRRIGHIGLCDAMWRVLAPQAARLTNDISNAHLSAAAEGFGSAALHALRDVLLTGRPGALPAHLTALAAIGHTSGWDALAGAVTALRAVAAQPSPSPD
jgi:hypothetical protein